jgi:hypothetical protein
MFESGDIINMMCMYPILYLYILFSVSQPSENLDIKQISQVCNMFRMFNIHTHIYMFKPPYDN